MEKEQHKAPIGWPNDCVYVDGLVYQEKNIIKTVEFESTGNIGLELFFVGKDSPAYQGHEKGRGVRAIKDILGGVTIGYYAGVYRPVSFAPTNSYVFDVGNGFVIDALEYGNITRFINDPTATIMFQGPKRVANVDTEPVTLMVGRTAFLTIELKTLPCGIKSGEELLMNYHVTDKSYWGPQHITTIDITGHKNVVVKLEKFDGEQLMEEQYSVTDGKRLLSFDREEPSLGITKRTRYENGLSVEDVLKKVVEAENELEIIKGLKSDALPDVMLIVQNADLNNLECLSETIIGPYSRDLEWQFALTMWWRLVKRSCEIFGLFELLRSQKDGALENRYNALVQEKLNGHGLHHRQAHKYARLGKFLSEFPVFVLQRQLITMVDWFQQVQGKNAALLDCMKSIIPVSSVFFRDAFQLHRHGFEVYPSLMKDYVSDTLVNFMETRVLENGVLILNNHSAHSKANDKKRMLLPVTEIRSQEMTALHDNLIHRLSILHPLHEVVSMTCQLSKDGCASQLAHTQCSKKFLKDVDDNQMPLACLVALSNGTMFDVWPGAIRFDERKTIRMMNMKLRIGDVLILRGDLVRAGSSAKDAFVTLHASMTIKGKEDFSADSYYLMNNKKHIVNRE